MGAKLQGRVLVIDDVITAGTAARESKDIIAAESSGAIMSGLVIALDRQEKGAGTELTAVQQVEMDLKVRFVFFCICTFLS